MITKILKIEFDNIKFSKILPSKDDVWRELLEIFFYISICTHFYELNKFTVIILLK